MGTGGRGGRRARTDDDRDRSRADCVKGSAVRPDESRVAEDDYRADEDKCGDERGKIVAVTRAESVAARLEHRVQVPN